MTYFVILLAVLVGTNIETYWYGAPQEFASREQCEVVRDRIRPETEALVAEAARQARVEAKILELVCVSREKSGV